MSLDLHIASLILMTFNLIHNLLIMVVDLVLATNISRCRKGCQRTNFFIMLDFFLYEVPFGLIFNLNMLKLASVSFAKLVVLHENVL